MMNNHNYNNVLELIHEFNRIDQMASLFQNEVGIHTFELKSFFDTPQRKSQMPAIWQVLKRGDYQGKKLIHLADGIWAKMEQHNYGEWTQPILKIVVNPRVFLDGEEGYLGITDQDVLERCFKKFEAFWRSNQVMLTVDDCMVSRADMCMNLQMSPKFPISGYIDLLRRSPYNQRYELYQVPNQQDSLHYVGFTNRRNRLCIYDKSYEQRRFSMARASQCPNLLRIELQMYRNSLWKVQVAQNIFESKDLLRRLVSLSPNLICQAISRILVQGTYVGPEELMNRIRGNGAFHGRTKEEMQKFVTILSRVDTFDELTDRYNSSLLRKMRECFAKMRISPAVIRHDCELRSLPGLGDMAIYTLQRAGKLR